MVDSLLSLASSAAPSSGNMGVSVADGLMQFTPDVIGTSSTPKAFVTRIAPALEAAYGL
jgi:hypothetical protein